MSIRNRLPILAVLAVIFTAGCIGQQVESLSSNGLVVKNLFIDPPEDQIQSGEFIEVTADIENVGGASARNVVAEIIGASWLNLNDPQVQNALLTGQIRLSNWLEFDEDGDGKRGVTITGPDPRFNLPGQLKTVVFRLPAPLLAEGQRADFDLKIRITYDYETSAILSIPGFSRQRYNTLFQQGKITQPTTVALETQVSPNVPVTISVSGPDKLIIGPFPYDEYVYQFTFRNVGSSIPVTLSPVTGRQEDGLLLGTIWVQGPGVFWRRCLGIAPETFVNNYQALGGVDPFFTNLNVQYQDRFSAWYQETPWGAAWNAAGTIGLGSAGDLFVSVGQQPAAPQIQFPAYVLFPNAISWEVFPFLMDPIKLRRGSSVTKSCSVGIINQPLEGARTWEDRPEDTILINAQLKYRYFIDQNVGLTVTAPVVRFPVAGPQT